VSEALEFGLAGLRIQPGDHICGFFFGLSERDDVLLPYLRAGLESGDKCICVVDASEPADLLASIGPEAEVDGYVTSDQLDVRAASEAYLRNGRFSPEEQLTFYEDLVRTATTSDGYGFARIAGEASWVLDEPPGGERLIEYESELNRFVGRYPQAVFCLYDLARFGGGLIMDLLKTHPKLLLGGMIIENPNYLSPDEFRATRS
jgi:MEDS: MEthanogen/methylotroph, DcmR Sensory domain